MSFPPSAGILLGGVSENVPLAAGVNVEFCVQQSSDTLES